MFRHLWGGILLVAGTAIGGGMLALPVATASAGFLPSAIAFFLSWLFMLGTAFLFAEMALWQKEEINFVSMARMTLGIPGQILAWVLYLFLFYSLTVAYTAAGGGLVVDLFPSLPEWLGPVIFVLLFAPFVLVGPLAVDRLNWLLMGGLIITLLLFFSTGFSRFDGANLQEREWSGILGAVPLIITSFGFQGLVPTLTQYLGRDPSRIKRALFWGSLIPLFIYLLWELLILGVVPLAGLRLAEDLGKGAVFPLGAVLHLSWLYTVGQFFTFFAVTTSFLGVTLAVLDFLADGLRVKKSPLARLGIATLIFLPAMLIAMTNPTLFIKALRYGGGFGCALLLGLLPIIMAAVGRYSLKKQGVRLLPGGGGLLTAMAFFILLVLFVLFQNI